MSTLIGYSLKKEIDSTLNPHLIMVWKKTTDLRFDQELLAIYDCNDLNWKKYLCPVVREKVEASKLLSLIEFY